MADSALLLVTIFTPLVGACLVSIVSPYGARCVRWVALVTTLLVLLLASLTVARFPADGAEASSFTTDIVWLQANQIAVHFNVGLDGLGLWMFGLSSLLMLTAVLVSWEAIKDRPALFYGMLLLLECGCLGVFTARDIMLFYVFFEFTLIPLFFLIGIWGSESRLYASTKFFLFTLAGSVLTFLGLLAIVVLTAQSSGEVTFSIPRLTELLAAHPLSPSHQLWIFLALFAGFAIKVPLFPVHTWLPLAHVQAPTAGSVFLAGVLLKIGTYGFVRFNLPLLPDASAVCMPWLLWLAAIGIVYGSLVALAQTDMKKLIAYSSVAHLGFCMIGLFSMNRLGMHGGVLQMINHGISTGGLFAVIGMTYERYHTREIASLGGLTRKLPILSFFMVVFTLSSISLPGTNGFSGEFLILLGIFQRAFDGAAPPGDLAWQFQAIALLTLSGVVLGAWYMLTLVQKVFFGPLKEPHAGPGEHHPVHDLSLREIAALAPLVVFVVWIGLFPQFFLDRMAPTLNDLQAASAQSLEQNYAEAATAAAEENATRVR
ncbi:complex I subunit 4 family protein [Lignipirellula cremea]|uniref:NADH-quinone oxidoreductase subunit M n=1 Tax=Lignipirellula cremea TaxID=2528010 RepID=A0A518DQV0_9BACT|nr:NADH-quinone oxidoreductase subunit M [Lignipirellula cremea]QDU94216.1 NADH-quinone oxidoreductase subunit M [Lignipirellula cremea]